MTSEKLLLNTKCIFLKLKAILCLLFSNFAQDKIGQNELNTQPKNMNYITEKLFTVMQCCYLQVESKQKSAFVSGACSERKKEQRLQQHENHDFVYK